MDVTDITCSYCEKPAVFFYQGKKSGGIYCACFIDNEAVFKNTFIIENLYLQYIELKKEEVINFIKMNEALE